VIAKGNPDDQAERETYDRAGCDHALDGPAHASGNLVLTHSLAELHKLLVKTASKGRVGGNSGI